MRVVLVYSAEREKLDAWLSDAYIIGKRCLDLRYYSKEKMKDAFVILNRYKVEGDIYIILGNKKIGWRRFAEKIFTDTEVVVSNVGEWGRKTQMELPIRNSFIVGSLKTDVIAMNEWEEAISAALEAISVSLYNNNKAVALSKNAIAELKLEVGDKSEYMLDQTIKDVIKQKRFYLQKHGLNVINFGWGEIWDESFTMFILLAGKDRASRIVNVIKTWGLIGFKYQVQFVKALKMLGDHAKRFGRTFDPEWKWFVNWDMLWKYGSFYEPQVLRDDVLDWFKAKEVRGTTEDSYYRYFRKNVERFFSEHWQLPNKDFLSWRQWLRSANWGTTGASDFKRLEVFVEGKIKKAAKTKNASILVEDFEELEKILVEDNPQVNIISVKPDEAPNKTRLIASSDGACYLLMSYMSTALTDGYSGKVSTLYKSSAAMTSFWLSLLRGVNTDMIVKCPLDQKGFDHHATRRMILIVLDVMKTKISTVADMGLAIDTLIRNIGSDKAKWKFKLDGVEDEGTWFAGIPSGWRWTADMDTIINYAEFYTIVDLLMDVGKRVDIWGDCFQGDDVELQCLSAYQAACVIAGYDLVGLEVNKGKFFVDTYRDEFLRKVVEKGVGVSGYPARSVHSLLWRVPGAISVDFSSPQEVLDLWLMAYRRGADRFVVFELMYMDMMGIWKASYTDIKDWIHTPTSLGGGGIFDRLATRWVKLRIDIENLDYTAVSKLQGLDQVASDWRLTLLDSEKNAIVKAMSKPMNMQLVRSKKVVFEEINPHEYTPCVPLANPIYYSSAIWKSAFPNMLRSVVIARIHKREDLYLVRDYLEDKVLVTLDRLKANASMQVIKEWLQGGFKCVMPRMVNVAQDYLAGMYDEKWIMRSVMGMHHLTMKTIKRVQLWWEMSINTSKKLAYTVAMQGENLNYIMLGS